jgi:hypothetical protein
MRVHSVTIFADKSCTPGFDTLNDFEDAVLRIHTGDSVHTPPGLTIFFGTVQEAIKFKNDIISSWEAFLRHKKEKS